MAGSSTRSEKAKRVMCRDGTMSPFVKEEFVKEESMAMREHKNPKENHESLKQNALLREMLYFERSEKMRLQKEMRELKENFLGLKRDKINLREEILREKNQREEYEKLLEEMETKKREDMKTIISMRDKIHQCTLELDKWQSRFGELEDMVMDVTKDCLEVRSMYLNEMNGGRVSSDVVVGETDGIVDMLRTDNFGDVGYDLNKNKASIEKDAGVIDISDSEEDENLSIDRRDRNRSKSLERNHKDVKRLRISPVLNRDSVSYCKTEEGRKPFNLGYTPHPLSPSSSSTDTSSDSDAGEAYQGLLAWSKNKQDNLQFEHKTGK